MQAAMPLGTRVDFSAGPAEPAYQPWRDPSLEKQGLSRPPRLSAQAIGDDPFERAAFRLRRSARLEGWPEKNIAARILGAYLAEHAQGLADLITFPGRKPVPMPKGLSITDTSEFLVDGQPATETKEGRAWLEDRQARENWGPAVALMMTLRRTPRGAPRGPYGPPAPPRVGSEPPIASPASIRGGADAPLFDYSRLDQVPNRPQFDLPRYVPKRGVPPYIQAVATPANIQRVNAAAKQGAKQGGLAFYNTEPLRERFIGELGPERGQAAFEKFIHLNAATSPFSRIPENIRNASYHFVQSEQGHLPPAFYWDPTTRAWVLNGKLPQRYGHLQAGLHAKKISEVLQQGSLNSIENPKASGYAQNLLGNYRPIAVDRHDSRLWGIRNKQGRLIDAPPRTGYGFFEGLHQTEAAKMGMAPAQHQSAAWFGGASQTGVGSPLVPWLNSLEARVALTAQRRGISKEEALRRLLGGKEPLLSLGAAAAFGSGISHEDEE